MSLFNQDDRSEQLLRAIYEVLQQQLAVTSRIMEKVMSTSPVTQASFDAALSTFSAAFGSLLTAVQSVETGLAAVEASLAAASGTSGSDFSGELATIQNLQAQVAAASTSAQQAITSLPTADQPAPPAPSAEVKKG